MWDPNPDFGHSETRKTAGKYRADGEAMPEIRRISYKERVKTAQMCGKHRAFLV